MRKKRNYKYLIMIIIFIDIFILKIFYLNGGSEVNKNIKYLNYYNSIEDNKKNGTTYYVTNDIKEDYDRIKYIKAEDINRIQFYTGDMLLLERGETYYIELSPNVNKSNRGEYFYIGCYGNEEKNIPIQDRKSIAY